MAKNIKVIKHSPRAAVGSSGSVSGSGSVVFLLLLSSFTNLLLLMSRRLGEIQEKLAKRKIRWPLFSVGPLGSNGGEQGNIQEHHGNDQTPDDQTPDDWSTDPQKRTDMLGRRAGLTTSQRFLV